MHKAIEELQKALDSITTARELMLVEMRAADHVRDCRKANACEDQAGELGITMRNLASKIYFLKALNENLEKRPK